MNDVSINLGSERARKSRLGMRLKKGGYPIWLSVLVLSGLLATYLILIADNKLGYFSLAVMLYAMMWVVWFKSDLMHLPTDKGTSIDSQLDADFLAKLTYPISPKSAWEAMTNHWQEIFLTNHLLLDPGLITETLSENETDMQQVWQLARKLQNSHDPSTLSAGTVATAIILSSPQLMQHLTTKNMRPEDVLEVYDWLSRLLEYQKSPRPYFGGIGRDWAFGFTPNLEQFSTNVSQHVQFGGKHFHFLARSQSIDAMITGLNQSGGVAIVGNAGIGKTSAVYALAERLLANDSSSGSIKDHQVVSLNASTILSAAKQDLERLMLTLFGEALRSGNMIIFLDEAQLFFQEGVGSFDLSKILLPILQNRRLKIVCAFTSTDWQRLKTSNSSLTGSMTPIMLPEPSKEETLKIVEDTALGIEFRSKTVVSYEAIREAYRLSEEYVQEMSFPGKTISVLEQASSHPEGNVITAQSVQQAIEGTLGVKVGGVKADEADVLLNLEEHIHQRMVNQSRAVTVVANALRRSRAGVSNTKRPIGSFLFLGPTGVGKTELARSLAATYFKDEKNMIRLDMSEYQQLEDVNRLLSDGQDSESLILAIRKQPFSVVLLDEIEKAHSGILNLLLQLLDEGQITDVNGQPALFKNAIIIVTSNAGANDIIDRINQNQPLDDFERPLLDKLISEGVFRPELVNRFDETVLFRPLNMEELGQVAMLMLAEVNRNLASQNVSVELTEDALNSLVRQGYDPQFGSRPMRRVIQRTVENAVAQKILSGNASPGTKILLDLSDVDQSKDTTPISQ